jgi:transcriptional adapter 2-alpha
MIDVSQNEKRRTKEDRDVLARLRIFSRFHSVEQQEALLDGIVECRRLRKHLGSLRHYRSMGVRTLDQARVYETERRKREHQVKALRKKQSLSQAADLSGLQALLAPSGFSDNASLSFVPKNFENRTRQYSTSVPSSFEAASLSRDSSQVAEASSSDPPPIPPSSSSLHEAPMAHLLVQPELDLCKTLSLLPSHYLAIKEALIRWVCLCFCVSGGEGGMFEKDFLMHC